MIKICGLNKAFGDKVIFSNFNLEIPDKSFVAISGDSGSGKSTLLNMIGGIEKPNSGSIIVDGFDVTKDKNKNCFRLNSRSRRGRDNNYGHLKDVTRNKTRPVGMYINP